MLWQASRSSAAASVSLECTIENLNGLNLYQHYRVPYCKYTIKEPKTLFYYYYYYFIKAPT